MFSTTKLFFETNKHYLFLIYFLLLPFGGVYLIYCAFLLLLAILSFNSLNKNISNNYYFYLFSLIWLPMLFSLIDSINIDRSFVKTISLLPFLFIGLYISSNITIKKMYSLMSMLVIASLFWMADFYVYHFGILEIDKAILWRWSFIIRTDFYGDPIISIGDTIVRGQFVIPILGQVLSVLLPIIFEGLRKYSDSKIKLFMSVIISLSVFSTILLSGNRNAVVMMIISFSAWFFYIGIKCQYFKNFPKTIILGIVLVCMFIFTLLSNHHTRLASIFYTESIEIHAIDKLSSHRLPLWDTAYKMAKDNWLNGIGPRGFRYGYNNYKPEKGKYKVEYKDGSTHPHFALLEIFLETGLIGLFSLFLLFLVIFKAAFRVRHDTQVLLIPWLIALITAIVPNIGKAFYSSYWLTLILFILIGCASILNLEKQTHNQKI